MTVGICGLGLIGASMARAYKEDGHTVLGYDIDIATQGFALLDNIIDKELSDDNIQDCELLFVALYPNATIDYLHKVAPLLSKNTTVIDLCGTKQNICAHGFALAKQYGFTFVGGHPMAGKQFSGIKHSRATLFKGAPMVLVPQVFDDIEFLDKIKSLLLPAGFGKLSITTAEEHDRMIAFTSQLAHIVSNAYVKSPTAQSHKGFSAGSYKDLTRVAWLNENMWTELFIENKDALLFELDTIINSLQEYRTAIKNEDSDSLRSILRDGRLAKERVDG